MSGGSRAPAVAQHGAAWHGGLRPCRTALCGRWDCARVRVFGSAELAPPRVCSAARSSCHGSAPTPRLSQVKGARTHWKRKHGVGRRSRAVRVPGRRWRAGSRAAPCTNRAAYRRRGFIDSVTALSASAASPCSVLTPLNSLPYEGCRCVGALLPLTPSLCRRSGPTAAAAPQTGRALPGGVRSGDFPLRKPKRAAEVPRPEGRGLHGTAVPVPGGAGCPQTSRTGAAGLWRWEVSWEHEVPCPALPYIRLRACGSSPLPAVWMGPEVAISGTGGCHLWGQLPLLQPPSLCFHVPAGTGAWLVAGKTLRAVPCAGLAGGWWGWECSCAEQNATCVGGGSTGRGCELSWGPQCGVGMAVSHAWVRAGSSDPAVGFACLQYRRIRLLGVRVMSEAVDLSFLSDVEKDLILQVLQRDEELRKAEERRIRCGWGLLGGAGAGRELYVALRL